MQRLVVALALMTAPLAAQDFELGLQVAGQSYRSQTVTINSLPTQIDPQTRTVFAGRFGYSIVDLGPALFQITAGYQPKFNSTVQQDGADSGYSYGQQYWSVGAMFNFKAFVAVGAGVEYRSEKLSLSGPNGLDESTTYGRPWARVNVGLAFPTPLVKPFIGVEAAAPLSNTSAPANYGFGPGNDVDGSLKSHAPNFQVGVYGGIRF